MNASERLAISLNILNVLDALATVYGVAVLGVQEANPIWRPIIHASPLLFVFLKLNAVALFSLVLARRDRMAPLALANGVYLGVMALHVHGFLTHF